MNQKIALILFSLPILMAFTSLVAGACVDSDADKGNESIYFKGTCVDDSGSFTDYCTGNTLTEYVCLTGITQACSPGSLPCTKGCADGACLKEAEALAPSPSANAGASTFNETDCVGTARNETRDLRFQEKTFVGKDYFLTWTDLSTASVGGKTVSMIQLTLTREDKSSFLSLEENGRWTSGELNISFLGIYSEGQKKEVSQQYALDKEKDRARVNLELGDEFFFADKPLVTAPEKGKTYLDTTVEVVFFAGSSFNKYVCVIGGENYTTDEGPALTTRFIAEKNKARRAKLLNVSPGRHLLWVSCTSFKEGCVEQPLQNKTRADSCHYSGNAGEYSLTATPPEGVGAFQSTLFVTGNSSEGVNEEELKNSFKMSCGEGVEGKEIGACIFAYPHNVVNSMHIPPAVERRRGEEYPHNVVNSMLIPQPGFKPPPCISATMLCNYPEVSAVTKFIASMTAQTHVNGVLAKIFCSVTVTDYPKGSVEGVKTNGLRTGVDSWVRSDVLSFSVAEPDILFVTSPQNETYYSDTVPLAFRLVGHYPAYSCSYLLTKLAEGTGADAKPVANASEKETLLGEVRVSSGFETTKMVNVSGLSAGFFKLAVSCTPLELKTETAGARGAGELVFAAAPAVSKPVFFSVDVLNESVDAPTVYSPEHKRWYVKESVYLNFTPSGQAENYSCSKKLDNVSTKIGDVARLGLKSELLAGLENGKHEVSVVCANKKNESVFNESDLITFFYGDPLPCKNADDCPDNMVCWSGRCQTCICVRDGVCDPCCGDVFNSADVDCAAGEPVNVPQEVSFAAAPEPQPTPSPSPSPVALASLDLKYERVVFTETTAVVAVLLKNKLPECDSEMTLRVKTGEKETTLSPDLRDCESKGEHAFKFAVEKGRDYRLEAFSPKENVKAQGFLKAREKKEAGFALPNWLWVVAVLALAGGIGYYYFKIKKKEKGEENEGEGEETTALESE